MKSLALGSVLLSFGLGCRTVQVGPIDLEPVRHQRVSMDRSFIEKSALQGQWRSVQQHLKKVDPSDMARADQSYALYWMGASHYHLNQYQSAQHRFDRAKRLGPTGPMVNMLNKAEQALSSYGHPGDISATEARGNWALQYGIFSVRKRAEDLSRDLSFSGAEIQIDEILHRGKTNWVVGSGPYQGPEAERKSNELRSKKVSCLIKPLNRLKP